MSMRFASIAIASVRRAPRLVSLVLPLALLACAHAPFRRPAPGTLVVQLVDAHTGAAIPSAMIVLRPARHDAGDSLLLAGSDSGDALRADRVRPGVYRLRTRRLGYSSVEGWVRVCAARTDTIRVELAGATQDGGRAIGPAPPPSRLRCGAVEWGRYFGVRGQPSDAAQHVAGRRVAPPSSEERQSIRPSSRFNRRHR